MGSMHSEIISPSSVERWKQCPPSFDFEKLKKLYNFDKRETTREEARQEGTEAHEIASNRLRIRRSKFYGEICHEELLYCDDKEMLDHVEKYVDYVFKRFVDLRKKSFPTDIWIEHMVDCSDYGANCVGSADAYIVGGNKLIVVDFKYGRKNVDVEDNDQVKIYALGVLQGLRSFAAKIQEIELIIYQPRRGGIKRKIISKSNLLEWGENTLRPALIGVKSRSESASRVGPWCTYCKGNTLGVCRAYYQENYAYSYSYNTLNEYEVKRIAELIQRGEMLKQIISEDMLDGFPTLGEIVEKLDVVKDVLNHLCRTKLLSDSDAKQLNEPDYSANGRTYRELFVVSGDTPSPIRSISEFRVLFKKLCEHETVYPEYITDDQDNMCLLWNVTGLSKAIENRTEIEGDKISENLILNIAGNEYVLVKKSFYEAYRNNAKLIREYLKNVNEIYLFAETIIDGYEKQLKAQEKTKERPHLSSKEKNSKHRNMSLVNLFREKVLMYKKNRIGRSMRKMVYEKDGDFIRIPLKDGYVRVPDKEDWVILDNFSMPSECMYAGVVETRKESLNGKNKYSAKHFVFFSDYRYGKDYPDGLTEELYNACYEYDPSFKMITSQIVDPEEEIVDGKRVILNEEAYLSTPSVGLFSIPEYGDPIYSAFPGYERPHGAMVVRSYQM